MSLVWKMCPWKINPAFLDGYFYQEEMMGGFLDTEKKSSSFCVFGFIIFQRVRRLQGTNPNPPKFSLTKPWMR